MCKFKGILNMVKISKSNSQKKNKRKITKSRKIGILSLAPSPIEFAYFHSLNILFCKTIDRNFSLSYL